MNTTQLFKISKYAYEEAFIDSQLATAGSNQAKIMEKLEQDKGYMKSSSVVVKVMVVIYLALMILFPIQTFSSIRIAMVDGINTDLVLFLGSLIFGLFFLLQTALLMTFEIFFTSGIFSGHSFHWLSTMPLAKKDLQKIVFFAFIRGMDWPIIAMLLVLPIGVAIGSQSILLTLIALVISAINMIFTLSVLTKMGERLSRLLSDYSDTSKKTSFLRIGIMIGYIVLIMIIILAAQFVPQFLSELFYANLNIPYLSYINYILSVIPFPTNGGYLFVSLFIKPEESETLIATISVGFIIYCLLNVRLAKNAISRLINVVKIKENTGKNESITRSEIEVKIKSPTQAFFTKEKQAATRDMQVVIWLVIPFIYGILAILMAFDEGTSILSAPYMIISAVMITVGIMRTDSDGATLLASLPYSVRDHAKSKMRWYFIILPLAFLLPPFLLIGKVWFWTNLITTLIWFPLGPLTGIMVFLIKVRLFGKLKYKYVIEEVNKKNKIGKWALIVVVVAFITIGTAASVEIANDAGGLGMIALVFIPIEIILSIILYLIFNHMFPKK